MSNAYNPFANSLLEMASNTQSDFWGVLNFYRPGRVKQDGDSRDEITLDPFVTIGGKDIRFQRGLVWGIDQKRALVRSVIEGIGIGTITFWRRDFFASEAVSARAGAKVATIAVIDGKQRLQAMWDFLDGKFDYEGHLFTEWSEPDQKRFARRAVNVRWLPEEMKDEDVLRVFILLNEAGTPMDKKHIKLLKQQLK